MTAFSPSSRHQSVSQEIYGLYTDGCSSSERSASMNRSNKTLLACSFATDASSSSMSFCRSSSAFPGRCAPCSNSSTLALGAFFNSLNCSSSFRVTELRSLSNQSCQVWICCCISRASWHCSLFQSFSLPSTWRDPDMFISPSVYASIQYWKCSASDEPSCCPRYRASQTSAAWSRSSHRERRKKNNDVFWSSACSARCRACCAFTRSSASQQISAANPYAIQ